MKELIILASFLFLSLEAFATRAIVVEGKLDRIVSIRTNSVKGKIITENGAVYKLSSNPAETCKSGRYKIVRRRVINPRAGSYSLLEILRCSNTAPTPTSSKFERITTDEALVGFVDAFEHKHGIAKCKFPKTSRSVRWRCLNGPQCGYTFDIKCKKGQKKFKMTVDGNDSGTENRILNIKIK